jgi:hypothetical protein
VSRLAYRLAADDDIPALRDLWATQSDWGSISEADWRQWYVDTPMGPALVVVAAEESGRLVGQITMMVVPFWFGDREMPVLRLSAPIVDATHRTGALVRTHAVVQLAMHAGRISREHGHTLAFTLPHPNWAVFLKRFPGFEMVEHGCAERPVGADVRHPARATAAVIDRFGDDYDRFWDEARSAWGIRVGVARRHDWLNFKHGGSLKIEVRTQAGERAGFAVVRPRDGLITDLLTARPDLVPDVLAAVLRFVAELARAGHAMPDRLKAMVTPQIGAALETLDFTPVPFRFPVASYRIGKDVPTSLSSPAGWFVAAGD